jgi:uncharacterized protein with gpF-like domain
MTIATNNRQREREKRRFNSLIDIVALKHSREIALSIKKAMIKSANSYANNGYIDNKVIEKHQKEMRAIAFKLYSNSIDLSSDRQFQSIKHHFPVEMEKKDAQLDFQELAIDFITTYGMRLARQVSDTTIKQVNKTIDRSVQEGLSTSETVSVIRDRASILSRSRAMTIAVTETHNALSWAKNESTRLISDELGLELLKEWNTVEDERTRQSHREADGQKVGMDESFTVGGESLRYAGDINGSAANTINCRCTETYTKK